MTILERITGARVWKGASVERAPCRGRPAWKLTHPSGAVAYVYEDVACIQTRHWEAYMEARRMGDLARRRPELFEKYRVKAVAHFEKLSGMKFQGESQP